MKHPAGVIVAPFEVPGAPDAAPLFVQVYRRIRSAIISGALGPGERLPSARTLAADLAVSRTTVEAAYDQLRAEGFLARRVGSGTYVAHSLPDSPRAPRRLRRLMEPPPPDGRASSRQAVLPERGQLLVGAGASVPRSTPLIFATCSPDLGEFPLRIWTRILTRRARRMSATELGPGDLAGYRPLREAIATHVAAARAVRCDWRQVIVFSSTQQSLDLAARLLLDPGDSVWMEEPGYPGARAAFTASGARVVPVPVDGMGLSVSAGKTLAPATRLAYVTPSHQFPLGTTLSLARRLELLRWATEHEAWIIEDDYDSEFRYTGRPLASLQGIDGGERVIYAGTFNKIFFPSLRLAFLIVPEALVDSFTAARAATDGAPPTLLQGALADFIASGHLAAHIRRMRELYRSRRDALLDAASEIGRLVALGPADTGLHVVAHLPDGADDRDIARRAHAQGLGAPPLSRYYLGPPSASGLLLGYAHEPPERIRQGIRTLARVLSASRKR